MATIYLTKYPGGILKPADEASAEALNKFKVGEDLKAEIVRPRNGKFLRKWFALAKVAFEIWEETAPMIEYKGERVCPEFDRFRKDLTILCGYYRPVFNVRNECRLEAASIGFASMSEEEFEDLYSRTITVILKSIIPHRADIDPDDLKQWVDDVMQFA